MTGLRPWPAEQVTAGMTLRLDGHDTVVTATCARLDGSGRVPVWHTRGCIRVTPGTALAVVVDADGEPVRAPELTAEQTLTRCQPVSPIVVERRKVAADVHGLLNFLLGREDGASVVDAAARLADLVQAELGASLSGADVRRDWPTERVEFGNETGGRLLDVTESRERAERAVEWHAFPVRLMRRRVLQLPWVPVDGRSS